jgi:hypothetical protein
MDKPPARKNKEYRAYRYQQDAEKKAKDCKHILHGVKKCRLKKKGLLAPVQPAATRAVRQRQVANQTPGAAALSEIDTEICLICIYVFAAQLAKSCATWHADTLQASEFVHAWWLW